MPRFAANLSTLFSEVPFLERFERAARAGFTAVECQFPYDVQATLIRSRLQDHGLAMVLHNLPGGDSAAGERGMACDPERVAEFRRSVAQGIDTALTLDVHQLNCLAGKVPPRVPELVLRRTFTANLLYAATQLDKAGLRLLIEPINSHDVPGFYLNRTAQAVSILAEVGADNAFVQYDVYHAQRMEGDLAASLKTYLPHIAHIQIADNPGRHEPGTGEIHWPFLFAHLDHIGYDGWVGCEYKPATTTEAGLGWVHRLVP